MRADPSHDAVCESAAAHRVVIAPPGTGKTFLSVRLAGLAAADLPAHAQVLVLTFSNQARTQLEIEAVRQLTPAQRRSVEITNYHRFFWRAVQSYRQALGLPLEVDLVSRKLRLKAFEAKASAEVKTLKKQAGLLESLAEHSFEEMRDARTPTAETLDLLLQVVDEEQRAGRLVFDDLGALFWRLLESFPAVDEAYRTHFPIVIADEHQDASALQDAVVQRLGKERLVIFGDPMQLIHGFRGADVARLEQHRTEADAEFTLTTPHRWHGDPAIGEWLLAVRRRLEGESAKAARPPTVAIVSTPTTHGFNGVLNPTKVAVSGALKSGRKCVAVLAYRNDEVGKLQGYLTRAGFYPRQLSSTDDFEDAREVIEQLPLLLDPETLAREAVRRVATFVPTLPPTVVKQVEGRLKPTGVKTAGCSEAAAPLLAAVAPLYAEGPGYFFHSVMEGLRACAERGLHMPKYEAVRAFRETTAEVGDAYDLDEALRAYRERVAQATHAAPRLTTGIFVMTTHQAKGKEFDAVILVNATEENFPDTPDGRRLFYVAITRATSGWTVIAPEGKATPLAKVL